MNDYPGKITEEEKTIKGKLLESLFNATAGKRSEYFLVRISDGKTMLNISDSFDGGKTFCDVTIYASELNLIIQE